MTIAAGFRPIRLGVIALCVLYAGSFSGWSQVGVPPKKTTSSPPAERPSPPPRVSEPARERSSPPPRASEPAAPAPRPSQPNNNTQQPRQSQPTYTPPAPGSTYRPPAGQTQSPSTNTNRPGASSNTGGGTTNAPRPTGQGSSGASQGSVYRPGASSTAGGGTANTPRPAGQGSPAASQGTIYRPGASSTAGSGQGSTGTTSQGTVYRPGASGSPGGASSTPGGAPSATAPARSSNGVTTYTPRASASQPAASPVSGGASSAQTPRQAGRTAYTAPASTAIASKTPTGASVLNIEGSRSVVQQVNGSRAGMKGINGRPIPQGAVTMHPNGNLTVATASGKSYGLRANGTVASIASQDRSISFRPNGRVAAIHTPSLDIQRGIHGERVIRSVRPDHSVLVSTGARNGYLERSVMAGNRTIIQRTYVTNGRVFSRAFVSYPFRGGVMPLYVPSVYFGPAFYGWAFYPWATPAPYAWGWGAEPWFGFYSGYFQPYPAYPGPAAWLADYFISRTLADEYAAQNQAPPLPGYDDAGADGPPPGGELYAPADSPITPAIRDAIAEEVGRQLAYENAISSGAAQPTVQQLPNALKQGRIFVVSAPLQVTTADGQTCDLTPADVLRLNAAPTDDSPAAILQVASTKRQDCPVGVNVTVQMQDLAEMQNSLRAQMDAGLDLLHSRQGQGGLPAAPPSAMATAPYAALDVPLPPNPNVSDLLAAQQQDAQKIELATVQQVASNQ